MGPDPTNDELARRGSDAELVEEEEDEGGAAKRKRCGVWSADYLRTFTTLLSENTVLLKGAQGYSRNDPIHEQRAQALEHLRQELRMASVEEVKQRINTFKKYAGNRLRRIAEQADAHASPESILRAAPRWLGDLAPHLNLWTQIFRKSRKLRLQTGAMTQEPGAAGTPQTGGGAVKQQAVGATGKRQSGTEKERGGSGTRLALEMVRSARALRSLDARAVCRRVCVRVPAGKLSELQCVWWRMLDVVRRKLALQRDGAGGGGAVAAALCFSAVEAQLADLLLLLDDSLCTLSESGDYDSMEGLVELFHLAQLYRLEEPPGEGRGQEAAARWRRAHRAYQARTISFRGTCRSLVLLQRRWHELKGSARRSVQAYSRAAAPPPEPLHTAIVRRFPHVVTAPLPTWRELVNAGAVLEDADQSEDESSEPEPEAGLEESQLEGVRLLSARDLSRYRHGRFAREEEDDLVLIEKEIETIDLINVADEGRESPTSPSSPSPSAQHYAFHEQVKQQLKNKRKKFANQLQEELDRQLRDIQLHEGVSEMTLLQESRPEGAPLFIYDSDSDLDCTEDRLQNIELIASTLGADEEPSLPGELQVKLEASSPPSSPAEDDEAEGSDDECHTIDEKLLMDARVVLVRVEDGGAGLPPATPRPRKRSLFADGFTDHSVKVKIERIDAENSDEPKGRQVKTIAKKLISEIMREESEELTPVAPNNNSNKKKVQLPNIDEVRKNNLSMLTAQVAPLTTDSTAGLPPLKGEEGQHAGDGDTRRSSTDSSSGSLRIDEGGGVPDDVTLTPTQLQRALARLDGQRCAEVQGGAAVTGAQHCCTARRQRALNAARRRLAARSGRAPPAPLDLHGASVCVREGRCACCCRHLLAEEAAGAQLQREAEDIRSALGRLLSSDDPVAQKSGDSENSNNKNRSNKNRKTSQAQAQVIRETESSECRDPLQEWFRQKTINQQYFNLNLKTKPQPPPQPQPQEPNSPQPAAKPFRYQRAPSSSPASSSPASTSPASTSPASSPAPPPCPAVSNIVIGTQVKPPNAPVVSISNAQLHLNTTEKINTSVSMITAPSKQLPRGAFVKLSQVLRHAPAPTLAPAPAPAPAPSLIVKTSSQGKILISIPSHIKIVPAASNLGNTIISTASQRKIDEPVTDRRKLAASAASLGKIVKIVPEVAKRYSPIKLKKVDKREALAAARAAGFMKPIRIAPRPGPLPAGRDRLGQQPPPQGDQALPAQGDGTNPGQGDQAMAEQDDEATPGRSTAPEERQSGAGLTVVKISSSTAALPVVSSPRSLLRSSPAPASHPPGESARNEAGAGAAPASPQPEAASVIVDPNAMFKRKDRLMLLESFLGGADPTRLVLQCVDAEAGVLAPLPGQYVLSEAEPRRKYAAPTYWCLAAAPNTARVIFEDNIGSSPSETGGARGSGGAGSAVLDAPDKLSLDNKVYVKIKDKPLLYARVLFALRSAEECHEELVRDTALHFVQASSGAMCSLSRDASRGPDVFALLSPNISAAKALAVMLNQLQLPVTRGRARMRDAARGGAGGGVAARADANARADVVMMMNNVNRKPIEMVYVDSDDEAAATAAADTTATTATATATATATDFKGLEHFEELEDFEL